MKVQPHWFNAKCDKRIKEVGGANARSGQNNRASFDRLRACSYDPAFRDVSPSGEDISLRSYGVFHPACRDEILLLAFAKHVHFSHAAQLFNDFSVFLHLFARKSIALARYLTLSYNTNIKLSKKC